MKRNAHIIAPAIVLVLSLGAAMLACAQQLDAGDHVAHLLADTASTPDKVERFAYKSADNPYVRVVATFVTVPDGSGSTGDHVMDWQQAPDDASSIWSPATPDVVEVPAGYSRARYVLLWQRDLDDFSHAGLVYATVNDQPGAVGGAKSIEPSSDWVDTFGSYWFPVQPGDELRLAFDLWDMDTGFDTLHWQVEFK